MRAWLREHCDWQTVVIAVLTLAAVASLVAFGDDTASCSVRIESSPTEESDR